VAFGAEFGVLKPIRRKLAPAISHVFSAEDAELKHFLGRELRAKIGVEVPADWFREKIDVVLLHEVVDDHVLFLHFGPSFIRITSSDGQGDGKLCALWATP